jgi:hypothetical protein
MVSRAIRGKEPSFRSDEELQGLLKTAGFGMWINTSETSSIASFRNRYEALRRQSPTEKRFRDAHSIINDLSTTMWKSENSEFQSILSSLISQINELNADGLSGRH